MKSVSFVLAAASFLASATAFAEVKENGTFLPEICGSTGTFPVATEVCVVRVQGSSELYLALNSIRTEIFPPDADNAKEYAYAFVTSVKTKGNKTIYKSVLPNSEVNRQLRYELVVENKDGQLVGSLKFEGHSIFGGDFISMSHMAITQ